MANLAQATLSNPSLFVQPRKTQTCLPGNIASRYWLNMVAELKQELANLLAVEKTIQKIDDKNGVK